MIVLLTLTICLEKHHWIEHAHVHLVKKLQCKICPLYPSLTVSKEKRVTKFVNTLQVTTSNFSRKYDYTNIYLVCQLLTNLGYTSVPRKWLGVSYNGFYQPLVQQC